MTARAAAGTDADAPSTGFGAYLFIHGAWFLAFGVQMVLFPYLVRVELQENAVRLGVAQMSLSLPTTLLILFGGFVADRLDAKRIMSVAYVAAAAVFLALGGLVAAGRLTYGLLIGYALVVGVIGAFAQPARDSLLSHVAPPSAGLQKAVAGATMAQFIGQVLGMLAALAAPLVGVAALLFGQAALMATALAGVFRVRPRPAEARREVVGHPIAFLGHEIAEGFRAAVASPVIGPVLLCATGMGVCFMGAFAVLLPLIVQSYFPPVTGNPRDNAAIASALAGFNLCFWVGSITSATVMMRLGPPRRKGLAYLLALASGSTVLILCAIPSPMWVLFALNFAWGLGGGVAMTLGRGLVQEYAPAHARARVLSIFTLGLMGGGPIGALAYGFLAQAIGPRPAILVPGLMMLVIVATVATRSRLRTITD